MIKNFGNSITGLFPCSQKDIDEYRKIKQDEQINIKWDYCRNKKLNDKYWVILNKIIDNYDNIGCTTAEMLHVSIKYELGYVKEIVDIHGQKRIIPDSTNFQQMGEKKFEKFYHMALDLLCKLLRTTREELEGEKNESL
jgi:hypothetical protein